MQVFLLPLTSRRSSSYRHADIGNNMFFLDFLCCFMKLWLRLPLEKSEPTDDDHDKVNNDCMVMCSLYLGDIV